MKKQQNKKELKIGAAYLLLFKEEMYPFINKNKEKYTSDELYGNIEVLQPGTIVTYIQSIIEVNTHKLNSKFDLPTVRELKIPVFYYENRLIVPYSEEHIMIEMLKEVVDDSP